MSASSATTITIIVLLAVLWLAVAAGVGLVAARRFRLAEQVLATARANATLLELAPSRPLLVRPNDKIEADPQLLRDIGLKSDVKSRPNTLADLSVGDSGFEPDDLAALRTDIDTARLTAGKLSHK